MIGIALTTGGKGMVAPSGSGRGVCINALSLAVPSMEEAPFVLDMATSVDTAGKLETALRTGQSISEG